MIEKYCFFFFLQHDGSDVREENNAGMLGRASDGGGDERDVGA